MKKWIVEERTVVRREVSFREKLEKDLAGFKIVEEDGHLEVDLMEQFYPHHLSRFAILKGDDDLIRSSFPGIEFGQMISIGDADHHIAKPSVVATIVRLESLTQQW